MNLPAVFDEIIEFMNSPRGSTKTCNKWRNGIAHDLGDNDGLEIDCVSYYFHEHTHPDDDRFKNCGSGSMDILRDVFLINAYPMSTSVQKRAKIDLRLFRGGITEEAVFQLMTVTDLVIDKKTIEKICHIANQLVEPTDWTHYKDAQII